MENNAKIDPKRLPVLEAYHQGKTVEEISQNCPGISRATIYNWIKEYKEGKVSRKPRAQTAEKKRLYAAALAFHKEGYSICEIQRAIKLVSYATVRRWVMETSTKNKPPLIKKKQIPLSDKKTAAEIAIYDGMTPEELLVRYRQLLEQNKRQRAQIELAETMIDVAEEELGIEIWCQVVRRVNERDRHTYPVSLLCELLGKTKQAYYKSQSEPRLLGEMRERAALDFVKGVRQQAPGIGLVKLWYMYNRQDRGELRVGRDKFVRYMRLNELQIRNRSYRPRTTDSNHGLPVYPNLVRELIPSRPNQLWVSDITYWATGLAEDERKFYYISLITDAYSHEIVGVDLSRTLSLDGPVRALDKALRQIRKKNEPLIHHSDRGCQYASLKYVKKLKKAGIMISMTENGDPKENAIAERINGIIKNEILGKSLAGSFKKALKSLSDAVSFYNNERPHMSCGMLTPNEAGQETGDLGKKWRSYREEFLASQRGLD